VKDGSLTLISNVPKAREIFEGHGYVWTALNNSCKDAFRWGGWFGDEGITHPHFVIADRGAWPGGLGAAVDGSLVVVRLPEIPAVLQEAADAVVEKLTASKYRGLFAVEFEQQTGVLKHRAIHVGWLPLQLHAFLAEVPLAPLLLEEESAPLPRFVAALPLSLPPWPIADAHYPVDQPVQGLTEAQLGRVWWHDVQFSLEEKALRTAGLDGLLGICVADAHNFELARGRVLEVAQRLQMPELQYRHDVGAFVPTVLAGLEETLGLRL